MKKPDWIDAASACAALGVKPATLYAYVSRGRVRARSDPRDARRSLYARQDVEALARQSRRPRARDDIAAQAIRWGDPVLETSISDVREGQLWLRGRRAADCAQAMTLEEMAAWLCQGAVPICPTVEGPYLGSTPFGRALRWLSGQLEEAPTEATLLAGVANACLGEGLSGPIHRRLARAWHLGPPSEPLLRQALVLLSDHELNPSTFAVRVAASTGASLQAALLAGMATLSGPRHGGAGAMAHAALDAAAAGELEAFLARPGSGAPYGFGFGHPLYPDGDPRAAHLLAQLPRGAAERAAVDALGDRLGLAPNIDMALAALTRHLGAPRDAVAVIFTVGRLAGWMAHAKEQAQRGEIIRPRARYVAAG